LLYALEQSFSRRTDPYEADVNRCLSERVGLVFKRLFEERETGNFVTAQVDLLAEFGRIEIFEAPDSDVKAFGDATETTQQ